MSEKKRYYYTKLENPVKKRSSGFWKLIPSTGQRLEPDHENWLVIDLSDKIYHQQDTILPQPSYSFPSP